MDFPYSSMLKGLSPSSGDRYIFGDFSEPPNIELRTNTNHSTAAQAYKSSSCSEANK